MTHGTSVSEELERRAAPENFLSPAFSDQGLERQDPRTIDALSDMADIAIHEFRMPEELPWDVGPEGREVRARGWSMPGHRSIVPKGHRILGASSKDVLRVVGTSRVIGRAEHQVGFQPNGEPKTRTRSLYGFSDPVFASKGRYVAARVLICTTADAWFDPYATGFWEVTREARTDLRLDLKSAMHLVWGWGRDDHPALAYALSVAHQHPAESERMPFAPFTMLYERVIGLHLNDQSLTRRVAVFLSRYTVQQLSRVAPGRMSKHYLYAPVLEELQSRFGMNLRSDDEVADSRDQLLEAMGAVCRDLLTGKLRADQALKLLTDVTRAARILGGSN